MAETAKKETPKATPGEPRIGEGFPAAKAKAKSAISFEEVETQQADKEQCPHCDRWFKKLSNHLPKCKKAPPESQLDPKLLELITAIRARLGEASVKTIVHILTYAKQRRLNDPTAQIDAPVGWVEETGELHGMLIEYLLARWGPEQSETYVMLISLVVQWYGVIQINFIETGTGTGTGNGATTGQPTTQSGDQKQPDSLWPEGVRQDSDSKTPDQTGTEIVNP